MQDEQRKMPVVAAGVAAFLAWVGADFLVHAGVLARWWRSTAEYWHPPAELFKLIPFAYASFAITSAVLVWLVVRLEGPRPRLRMAVGWGGLMGVFLGVTGALGNYSVVAMPASALVVWPVSYVAYCTAAGAAAGWVLGSRHPWLRVGAVLALSLMLCIAGVVAQNVLV